MSISSDTVIEIIAAIALSVVTFWIGYAAKRPRLENHGGGTGSISIPNRDIMATSVYIYNHPSFFGLKVRREPATITSARIYDPELKEYVGPVLRWAKDGSDELEQEVIINTGKQRRLYLFAKERYDNKFFIFSAEKLNTDLPRQTDKYTDKKKEFTLVLFDDIGKKYKFNLIVRNTDQSVNAGAKLTQLRVRGHYLREALGNLRQAVWPR